MNEHDRRRSLRLPALLHVRPLSEENAISTELGDIGAGGVGFEHAKLPEKEIFRVQYALPGESRLHSAFVAVVRAEERDGSGHSPRPYYVGARFVDLSPDEVRALEDAVARRGAARLRALSGRPGPAPRPEPSPAPRRSAYAPSPSTSHS